MNPNSIVDFLISQGQPADYASRAKLAMSKGIQGYTGSAAQNLNLLQMLKTTPVAPPAPVVAPGASASTPAPATPVPAPIAPAGQPQSVQDLITMGFAGYQGWGNTEAVADFKATGGQGKGGPATAGATGTLGATTFGGLTTQPAIDLPQIYQNLYTSSGISAKQDTLTQRETQYLEAKAKISDNPFLSASMVDKRLQRLQNKYDIETKPLRDEIATKKADVETQLNLKLKQFDINSTQVKTALDQFNTLLGAGAYANASGEDIANITRATGISSTMIQAAIAAQKKKGVETQIVTADDASGQWAVVIDKNTGTVISKTKVAEAKPKTASDGVTPTQEREIAVKAIEALKEVDTNEDTLVSLEEYKKAVLSLISATGVNSTQADDYLTKQMNSLGYSKWNW